MVGFREENVLQVSSYYRADVQINYLAELVTDSSVKVKESVVEMLRELMTVMGDRYDHQTRCGTVRCFRPYSYLSLLLFNSVNLSIRLLLPSTQYTL